MGDHARTGHVSTPRALVVSAADDGFMSLLRGLLASLAAMPTRTQFGVACLDVGLSAPHRAEVAAQVDHLVEAGWDLEVAAAEQVARPALRALTARPFLPRYFPGYPCYLWLDADTWVQNDFALGWAVDGAAHGALAIATHADRAYRPAPILQRWRCRRAHAYFGRAAAERLTWDRYFNAGVFALAADAPHWAAWAEAFARGLAATDGRLCCDQTALNEALHVAALPVSPLPASCNWLCHLALPAYDERRQCFCEPHPPHHPIGVLHLTSGTKDQCVEVRGADGGLRTLRLRYPLPSP